MPIDKRIARPGHRIYAAGDARMDIFPSPDAGKVLLTCHQLTVVLDEAVIRALSAALEDALAESKKTGQ